MLLEIDAGNSRLKWRVAGLVNGVPAAPLASGALAGHDAGQLLAELVAALEQAGTIALSRILVSCVREAGFRQHCRHLLQDRFGVAAEFAVSTPVCGGVRNGYAAAERLGVDRWLAVVAAFAEARAACCVVDCGTTITLDVVRADGQHLGGYIVPGLRLMRDALAGRSAVLASEGSTPQVVAPGDNTSDAIVNGTFGMALGFIRDQHGQLVQQYGALRWYFTGGDAPLLVPQLPWESRLVPDLVLDGLRLALL